MFEEEPYEYDYDRILEDTEELYNYEENYDYDYHEEIEYENYYHSIVEEIAED
jgi:hypothetical protein